MSVATLIVAACTGETEIVQGDSAVSVERYVRADRLMGANLEERVFNYFMLPYWIGESDEFWYKHDFDGGHEFRIVDAATGDSRVAFDHEQVADMFRATTGDAVSAKALPFSEFSFNEVRTAINFFYGTEAHTCSLDARECTSRVVERSGYYVPHDMYYKYKPFEGPEGILLSPDKLFGVETRKDNNLWLHDFELNTTRALTTSGQPDFGWGLYPDNRADFVPRLYAGKKELPANTQWAPNSRVVLVPLIDQRHVETYPFLESRRKDGAHRPVVHNVRIPLVGERPADFVWYLIDVVSGEKRLVDLPYDDLILIQQDFIAVRDFFWSNDSTRLFMIAHGDNLESAFLFDVDIATGSVRTVIHEEGSPRMQFNSTTYNAANVRIVNEGKEAIWWSERDGWGHLYRYDIETGDEINRITGGEWLVRDIIEVDEERERIYFTAGGSRPGNPYYRHLYRVQFDGSDLTLLTPEDADHLLLPNKPWVLSGDGVTPYAPVSPSGAFVVYNYSRVDQPTKLAIRRVDTAELVAVVNETDASGLYEAGWRPPEEFKVTAPDGQSELWGTIYKPSDFDLGKKYPVIDAQYASPLTALTPRHFYQAFRGRQPLWPSSVAELGFIVVSVDSRGTTFRSAEFSRYGFGALNLIGLGDHVHAISELAGDRPYMDIERVGIIGHSYGGYSAVRAMLEFPEFYKVGIASAGPADLHALYNDYHWTAYHGRPMYRNESEWIGESATEVPNNYRDVAASLQADRLKGKLLIQFGELDENVPPGSVWPFVDALIEANRDFDMLYLPSRDHQFIGEGYVIRRDWDYLVRHLAGKEPPQQYELKVDRR